MITDTTEDRSPWPDAGELGDSARAYAFAAFKAMPTVYIASFLLMLALVLADSALHGRVSIPVASQIRDGLIAQSSALLPSLFAGIWFLKLLVAACVAVSVHRFILLRETTETLRPLGRRYAWAFALWLVALGLLAILLDIGMPHILGFLLSIAVIIVDVRLSLLFPAVAIGATSGDVVERIQTSWRRTNGKGWKLFWAGIVAIIPLLLIIVVFVLAGIVLSSFTDASSIFLKWGTLLILGAVGVVAPMCGAAVASLAYRAALDVENRARSGMDEAVL
jgi:hypothetical protein